MAEEKYNMKNPAVKRILQEVKEMQSNRIADYMSLPLEVCLNSFLGTDFALVRGFSFSFALQIV